MTAAYHSQIAAATGVTDPADAQEIEDVMRTCESTLDGLTAGTFDILARNAAEVVKQRWTWADDFSFDQNSDERLERTHGLDTDDFRRD